MIAFLIILLSSATVIYSYTFCNIRDIFSFSFSINQFKINEIISDTSAVVCKFNSWQCLWYFQFSFFDKPVQIDGKL